MSEPSKDDKTEKASPQKLREARNKGQAAKSQELGHWLMLMIFTLALLVFIDDISRGFRQLTEQVLTRAIHLPMNSSVMISWFRHLLETLAMTFFPLILCLVTVAVLVNVLQTGFLLSSHPIKPNFSKLNPVSGFKRLFSKRILFELLKTLLKMVLFVALVLYGVTYFTSELMTLYATSKQSLGSSVTEKLGGPLLLLLVLLLPVALMDFGFSRREFADKMKMSKRDVKDEHKKNEGSPEIKSKRKELQKSLLDSTGAIANVKDADMIITNPTHYAVALKYDENNIGLPVVVAKGKGELALKIRELSRTYSKPIIRRPALARLLFAECELEQVIPKQSIADVASLYRWLYEMNKVTR